jgi:hypothetical protein
MRMLPKLMVSHLSSTISLSSFPRKREPRFLMRSLELGHLFWVPAFAGMTEFNLLENNDTIWGAKSLGNTTC